MKLRRNLALAAAALSWWLLPLGLGYLLLRKWLRFILVFAAQCFVPIPIRHTLGTEAANWIMAALWLAVLVDIVRLARRERRLLQAAA